MATRQGYLWKRGSPTSPPAMVRVFCVLAGTTLWDYDTEEEAALGLRPKTEIDVIGVSPWDGKAKYHNYAFGFLFVSHLGTTYYASAQNKDDLESWLSAMRVGLQAKFGNAPARTEDAQGRPFQQPHKRDGAVCGVSGQPFNRSNPKCVCVSCGGVFGSEYCCEDIPLLHYKMQTGSRVCRNCFLAQYFLNHLKLLNSTLRTHLHELDLEGKEVTDKNSAKIRVFRRSSKEAHLAWELYESNQIDGKEFNELLKADLRMKEEREKAVLVEFQQDLDLAGEDAIVLLRYLFDFRDEGQPQKYILILKRLFEVAEVNISQIDFILPQLLQIFVLMSDRGLEQVLQLEALEQFIVRICSMSYAHIALRVVWAMMGYYEDTLQVNAPISLVARRARIARLTLHVEAAVSGDTTCLNDEILHIFTIPSDAQLVLIQREWTLVQNIRKTSHLDPFTSMDGGEKGSSSRSKEKDGRGKEKKFSFATEMKFVKELTSTAENLRHIDLSLRKETLRAALQRIQEKYSNVYFPITRDYGPMPKIIRICTDEGAVFRSKARVPVLLCFEVVKTPEKDGELPAIEVTQTVETAIDNSKVLRRRRTSSLDYVSEDEVEHLIDKGAFHERMSSLQESCGGGLNGSMAGLSMSSMILEEAEDTATVSSKDSGKSVGSQGRFTLAKSPLLGAGGAGYTSKAEVWRMVLNRRKKGKRKDGKDPSLFDEFPHSADETAIDKVDLATLLEEYESKANMDDSTAVKYISPAVATAIEEFKKGNLSEEELEMFVVQDRKFRRNIHEHAYLDAQFFVSMAFGEPWLAKKARVKNSSPDGAVEGWDLLSMIVKSNDDLRQEVCIVQLIELCRDIFQDAGLELWLEPYGIISTTSSTGIIETLTDALSFDALKKKEGYVSLAHHFEISYGHDASLLVKAKRAFMSSLAAYSLVCYVFQIKDRHNGNLLLDTKGHVVHIDYGFILGIAPGGNFSIETAPFKLTSEMVEVMGGLESSLFDEFITLFVCGFFALQVNVERIVCLIEIISEQSRFPCFAANDKHTILQKVRSRLNPGRGSSNKNDTMNFALDLIYQSYNSMTTRQYDNFQWLTNEVMP